MSKEYNVSTHSSQCRKCNAALQRGQEVVAALRELKDDFQREDYCLTCWSDDHAKADDLVGVWRTHLPEPAEKKKLFIDNDLLVNFFERLAGTDEPAKINFRYVLALVLMRKKLLVYDRLEKLPDGRELWKMHFRGQGQRHEVLDPKMDETKIAEVSQHLGQILEGEL